MQKAKEKGWDLSQYGFSPSKLTFCNLWVLEYLLNASDEERCPSFRFFYESNTEVQNLIDSIIYSTKASETLLLLLMHNPQYFFYLMFVEEKDFVRRRFQDAIFEALKRLRMDKDITKNFANEEPTSNMKVQTMASNTGVLLRNLMLDPLNLHSRLENLPPFVQSPSFHWKYPYREPKHQQIHLYRKFVNFMLSMVFIFLLCKKTFTFDSWRSLGIIGKDSQNTSPC